MLKWFSISGIQKEIKRIRWPKKEDIISNFTEVMVFCLFFAAFFTVCEFAITFVLKLIGIGA
ncbi:MAG: preprotein translocase subunit SecE [Erysipelotrichaceae bacterium]|nr:preprotein translocase subunit SecE [Erysipelotrichaceae bacterium]